MKLDQHILIFGASGAIGGSIIRSAVQNGWRVSAVSRKLPDRPVPKVRWLPVDPLSDSFVCTELASEVPYTSVCWAQGSNINDSIYNLDLTVHRQIYEANCTYIIVTLQALLQGNYLAGGSKLCIISSIWQNLARQSKLSYCMSKAALHGLVLSASADLAADGHLVNAVLPGVLETPMTRNNLDAEQIDRLSTATGHRRLTTLQEVASLVCYLCSPENTGITGQFITADLGFSHVRII